MLVGSGTPAAIDATTSTRRGRQIHRTSNRPVRIGLIEIGGQDSQVTDVEVPLPVKSACCQRLPVLLKLAAKNGQVTNVDASARDSHYRTAQT